MLIRDADEPHVGTLDVDVALNHQNIPKEAYRTMRQLLTKRGYKEGKQPFIFHRTVRMNNREIEVDFLAGMYEGTTSGHRTQLIQDIRARKIHACDLVFDMWEDVRIEGEHPGGGRDSISVRVASIVPFLVMKGNALSNRLKEKDAYDIYYCCRYYPGGLEAIVSAFQPHLKTRSVIDGLKAIRSKFSSPGQIGPKLAADFIGHSDQEERERIQRDAFERVQYLLKKLGLGK